MKRFVLLISLALLAGAVRSESRFTDLGDGTVRDSRTGLEWVKAPHSLDGNSGKRKWADAVYFCKKLSYASHKDWRFPTDKELESLVDRSQRGPALPAGHLFTGVKTNGYWSGTSCAGNTDNAWYVSMYGGDVDYGYKASYLYYVWPVRGGQ